MFHRLLLLLLLRHRLHRYGGPNDGSKREYCSVRRHPWARSRGGRQRRLRHPPVQTATAVTITLPALLVLLLLILIRLLLLLMPRRLLEQPSLVLRIIHRRHPHHHGWFPILMRRCYPCIRWYQRGIMTPPDHLCHHPMRNHGGRRRCCWP